MKVWLSLPKVKFAILAVNYKTDCVQIQLSVENRWVKTLLNLDNASLFSLVSTSNCEFIYCKINFTNSPVRLEGIIYWKIHYPIERKPMIYLLLPLYLINSNILGRDVLQVPRYANVFQMTCVVSPHQRAVNLICISSTPALWPWQLVAQLHCTRQESWHHTFALQKKNLALIPDSISMGKSPIWEKVSVMFSYHEKHSAVISAA